MYRFISFEGGDGSGKTTQSKKLHTYLTEKSIPNIWTREIGGTKLAEQIRDMVVSMDMLDKTELLMIMAARNEHIEKVIKPALSEGKIVICDRFIDSTAAYQAKNHDEIKKIYYLNEILFDHIIPDITFYIKLDPTIAISRTKMRDDNNKYEMKSLQYHAQVVKNYDFIESSFRSRIKTINGEKDEDGIFTSILEFLNISLKK